MTRGFQLNNFQLKLFIWVLAVIVMVFMFLYRFIGETGDDYKRVINGDGKGYYAYLPAVFIYHDLTFSFFDKDPERFGYQYSNTFLLNHDTHNLNKYTCGEAILLIPFFLLAMLASWLSGLPVDGYNDIFQVSVAIGTFSYLVAGLFVAKNFLRLYGLSNNAIAFSFLAIVLGTNILNYVVFESSMSHVFSFFTIGLNVYAMRRYFEAASRRMLVVGGLTLGLIILLRPINGMIVFAYPFLAGDKNFIGILRQRFGDFILAGLVAGAVIFIQLFIWKLEIGQFLVYGYKNEGFYFSQSPPMFDYLFSFKRGAFIYSPALFISLFGFWQMRSRATEMLWFLLFMLTVVFVHASWWSWYYGDGFGERPLIDFYLFFALLIAFAFEKIQHKVFRIVSLSTLAVFVILHQVFFYQYTHNIIHAYSMDFEKFKYVFLKTGKNYRDLFRCETEDFYHPHGVLVSDTLFYSGTDVNEPVPPRLMVSKEFIHQGEYFELAPNARLVYEVAIDSSWLFKARYAEVNFDYMQPEPDSTASRSMVFVTMLGKDRNSNYYNANQLIGRFYNTPGEWQHDFDRIKIGIPEQTGILLHVHIVPPEGHRLFVKNLKIKIVEAKH